MALKKKITNAAGADATYWRIGGLMFHEWEKKLEVYLLGYVSEEKRRAVNEDGSAKFAQLSVAVHAFTPAQWDEFFTDGTPETPPKATLYEFLKTLPDWQGATDV